MARENAHMASTSTSAVMSRFLNRLSILINNLRRSAVNRFLRVSRYGGGFRCCASFLCSNREITSIFAGSNTEEPFFRSLEITSGQLRHTAICDAKAYRSLPAQILVSDAFS